MKKNSTFLLLALLVSWETNRVDAECVIRFENGTALSQSITTFSINENAAEGTVLATLDITDPRNTLTCGNTEQPCLYVNIRKKTDTLFDVILESAIGDDYDNGIIGENFITRRLDLICPGASTESSFAYLVTFIQPINTHPPQFSSSGIQVELDESVPIGLDFSQYFNGLYVTDGDRTSARVSFTVDTEDFEILNSLEVTNCQTGKIKYYPRLALKNRLSTSKAVYDFQLTASDQDGTPLTSSIPVKVTVKPSDRRDPQFEYPVYTALLDDPLFTGALILREADYIRAFDGDVDLNEKITYNIQKTDGADVEIQYIEEDRIQLNLLTPLDETLLERKLIVITVEASQENDAERKAVVGVVLHLPQPIVTTPATIESTTVACSTSAPTTTAEPCDCPTTPAAPECPTTVIVTTTKCPEVTTRSDVTCEPCTCPTTTECPTAAPTECPVCTTTAAPSTESPIYSTAATAAPTECPICPTVTTPAVTECPTVCPTTTQAPVECPTTPSSTCPVCPSTSTQTPVECPTTPLTCPVCPSTTTSAHTECPLTCEPCNCFTETPSTSGTASSYGTACPVTCPACPTTSESTSGSTTVATPEFTTTSSNTTAGGTTAVTTDHCTPCPTTTSTAATITTISSTPGSVNKVTFERNHYSVELVERTPGVEAVTVRATASNNESPVYSLELSGNSKDKFQIDGISGVVTVVGLLYTGDVFEFRAVASVSTGEQDKTTVTVFVVRGQEICNQVRFDRPIYEVEILERSSNLSLVSLHLINGQGNETFEVAEVHPATLKDNFYVSGTTIMMKEALERRTSPELWLTVTVSQVSLISTVVHVVVQDVNEPPEFSYPGNLVVGYPSRTYLDETVDMPLFSFQAIDNDDDANSRLTYSLSQYKDFYVDSSSGILYSTDISACSEHCRMTVTATDQGGLSAKQNFTVMRLDQSEISVLMIRAAAANLSAGEVTSELSRVLGYSVYPMHLSGLSGTRADMDMTYSLSVYAVGKDGKVLQRSTFVQDLQSHSFSGAWNLEQIMEPSTYEPDNLEAANFSVTVATGCLGGILGIFLLGGLAFMGLKHTQKKKRNQQHNNLG